MREKRGASYVDWSISLAIFLIFVTWFFVFLLPRQVPAQDLSPLLDVLEKASQEAYWTVELLPATIISNHSLRNTPVIGPATPNFSFADMRPYHEEAGQRYFLVNATAGSNLLVLINASNQSSPWSGIQHAEDITTLLAYNFSVTFLNGTPDTLTYRNATLISALSPRGHVSNDTDARVVSLHRGYFDPYYLRTVVFDRNPQLQLMLVSRDADPGNVTFAMNLTRFGSYWSDALHVGTFNYTVDSCANYTSHRVALAGTYQLLFSADTELGVRLCTANTTLLLNLTLSANNTRLTVSPHEGAINITSRYQELPIMKLGLADARGGLSLSRLSSIAAEDYGALKKRWRMPSTTDFKIVLYNDTDTLIDIGPSPGSAITVKVKDEAVQILAADGSVSRARFNLRVW
ncbi:hypothetical protein AUJ68_04120 [Candidatus Woesearchaeota archaeon CG1_02_57_44]|nr:MAG: hypothetical protein AUJ68_04120 [Candidatus Woesearchaeota archaeon CG1_02_57_44]